jgi:C4-dicarboxylate-specific signal transduction histidine kinase
MQLGAGELASATRRSEMLRAAMLLLALAFSYYLGVTIGLAFTPATYPVSLLWPPNAIVVAALLLCPPRAWVWPLLAVLPAHLLAEVSSDVPFVMAALWYVSNCSEAVVAAGLVWWLVGAPLQFDRIRHVVVYLVAAVIVAPALSSFLDAAFVALVGYRYDGDYWELVRVRLPSNALAAIIVPPFAILTLRDGVQLLRNMRRPRTLESAVLLGVLAVVGYLVFHQPKSVDEAAIWVYAPLPVLIWAAVRTGAVGVSACVAVLALVSITGTLRGTGPFVLAPAEVSVLSLQIFLIITASTLMLLAAALAELRTARTAALRDRARLNMALSAAQIGTWKWSLTSDAINWQSSGQSGEIVARAVRSHDEILERAYPSDRGRILAAMRAAQERGEGFDIECRFQCDGRYRWIRGLGKVQYDDNGRANAVIGVFIDTTQRKHLELQQRSLREKLRHLTLAATLGELSGALAHELSQPLAAIMLNAQVGQKEAAKTHPDLQELRAILADIVADDERAGEVINRLRALVPHGGMEQEAVQVADCIHSILALEHSDLIARNVAVDLDIDPELPPVKAVSVQLQQVLLNLIVNACEAMAEKTGHRNLRIAARHHSGEIRMEVSDNGSGVEDFERIFEPFFSSRKRGVGLGLSIARSIVVAHGGRLWGANNAGGGATFYFTLPRA